MILLAYLAILCCVTVVMTFCAVQAFLMLTDAAMYRRDRLTSALGGTVMLLGCVACLGVLLWMLNHSPL